MEKSNNIKPTGLKGNSQVNRMKSLMGIAPITENVKRSKVELTKLGPDGNVYGIVRENHNYFIKIADNKQNLVAEDFKYMGGLQNKAEIVYESYAKAAKQLNLKFISLNEALGTSTMINILKNDNLMTESFESYSEAPKSSQPDTLMGTVKSPGKNDGHETEIIGDEGEDGNPDVDTPKTVEDADVTPKGDDGDPFVEDGEVELTETEKAIDRMILEVRGLTEVKQKPIENKLSIGTALGKIDEGVHSAEKKKK